MYNLQTINKRIKEKYPNEDLEVIKFTKVKEPTTILCKKCGQKFNFGTMDSVINSNKRVICDKCNIKRRDTLEVKHKIEYLINKNDNLELLNDFKNITTDLEILCKKCNNIYKRKPRIFLESQKCPYCESKSKLKPHNLFIKELNELYPNEYKVLDKYNGSFNKIKVKHKCGFIWEVRPHNLLLGKGCPQCNRKISKGEKRIEKYLSEKEILFEKEKSFKELGQLRFDFYLPDKNILIEFQGQQHYKPIEWYGGQEKFFQQQNRDNLKKQFCKKNNYTLIEIKFDQFNNIEQILNDWLND
jgi:very-short-patch-repair endonuclease